MSEGFKPKASALSPGKIDDNCPTHTPEEWLKIIFEKSWAQGKLLSYQQIKDDPMIDHEYVFKNIGNYATIEHKWEAERSRKDAIAKQMQSDQTEQEAVRPKRESSSTQVSSKKESAASKTTPTHTKSPTEQKIDFQGIYEKDAETGAYAALADWRQVYQKLIDLPPKMQEDFVYMVIGQLAHYCDIMKTLKIPGDNLPASTLISDILWQDNFRKGYAEEINTLLRYLELNDSKK